MLQRGSAATAVYSVWPQSWRRGDFDAAIEFYELAAEDVNGLLFPVASAWLAAWRREPTLALYSPDGLHPSIAGSYLAALVMYGVLYERSPIDSAASPPGVRSGGWRVGRGRDRASGGGG